VRGNSGADFEASDIKFTDGNSSFTVFQNLQSSKVELGRVSLPLRGLHNVSNAIAAIAMSMEFGVSFSQASLALDTFGGVARRFEAQGSDGGVTFIDDYAHATRQINGLA
jgi:UDP-N-acetylmuramate--alanine ligase